MLSIKRVLVPVDFSTGAARALDYALFLGAQFGATVDLLHVWQIPPLAGPDAVVFAIGPGGETLAEQVERASREELEQLAEARRRDTRVPLRTRLAAGDPGNSILQIATEGYDLVVMGTHGRTGLAHLLIGSVAEKVVRRAPCPVITVPLGSEAAEETAPRRAASA